MDSALLREFIKEVVISASPEYMKKEAIREHLQEHLLSLVADGQINSQEDLDEFFSTLEMATNALRGVPLEVWQKMSGV